MSPHATGEEATTTETKDMVIGHALGHQTVVGLVDHRVTVATTMGATMVTAGVEGATVRALRLAIMNQPHPLVARSGQTLIPSYPAITSRF